MDGNQSTSNANTPMTRDGHARMVPSPFLSSTSYAHNEWTEAFREASASPHPGSVINLAPTMTTIRSIDIANLQSNVSETDGALSRHLSSSMREGSHRWWLPSFLGSSQIIKLAAPMALTNLCYFALGLVSVAFVGRLGEAELAVAILATSLFNVSGLSILQGFNSALETLCGQAWGADAPFAVGVAFQRGMILNTLLTAGIVGLWWQAEPMLLLLGQDPALSKAASRYILLESPALWFAGLFEGLKRYHAAQSIVTPGTIATIIALLLAPVTNWLLIYRWGLGLDGAAFATVVVEFIMAAILVIFTVHIETRRAATGDPKCTWPGLSKEAWRGWGMYLHHALPSVVMICAEWWSFEMLIVMSGWLPNAQTAVAVMGILLNIGGMIWMIVSGTALACTATVAACLGAGLSSVAKRATVSSVYLAFVQEIVAVAIVLGARNSIGRAFTGSHDVVSGVAAVMPIFAASLPGDGVSLVLKGMLRGAGNQGFGAVCNLLSYWVFGLPCAYYFAFKLGFGMQGMWAGVTLVNTLQALLMMVASARIDFDAEAKKARRRVGELEEPLVLAVE